MVDDKTRYELKSVLNTKADVRLNNILAPQMVQMMEILQYTSEELREFIEKQIEINPLIDIQSYDDDYVDYQQDDDDDGSDSDYADLFPKRPLDNAMTLKDFLYMQIPIKNIDDETKRACECIIDELDDNGFLTLSPEKIAKDHRIGMEYVKKAIDIVQHMEPAGVGAGDIVECLLIQLRNRGITDGDVYDVVKNHLWDIAENKVSKVAKELGISVEEVQKIKDIIRTLNPKPGNRFYDEMCTIYVRPDIIIKKEKDDYDVIVCDHTAPQLSVDIAYFRRYMDERYADEQTRSFLINSIRDAKRLINNIEIRRKNLYKIAKAIVKKQWIFLEKGPEYLVPMELKDIAEDVNLSVSTVSRTIKGKYVQTPWGVYSMRQLFTAKKLDIREIIVTLINSEDPKKPLSDKMIAEKLSESGFKVSRRTVAAYREEMGIPASNGRRKFC